jgi:hypothetical protein
MGKKKIRRNQFNFPIHLDSYRTITFGPSFFYANQGASYTPVFLSVIFLIGILH